MRRDCWAAVMLGVLGCVGAGESDELGSAPASLAHVDFALPLAREDEKLAEDVEYALGQRWASVAEAVRECPRPLFATEDVLRERGLPDLEAGLPRGVFSDKAAQNRYFAALLLGWSTEPAGLKIAARVESRRLASADAARAELPDVDQRLAMDALARASSDRLHAFCRRLSTLGASCFESLLGPHARGLGPRSEL